MLGVGAALYDMNFYSRPLGLRNRLLRGSFIAAPVVAAGVSLVLAKEMWSNVAEKMGKDRNALWTYALAPMGPGAVLGVACKP